MKKCISPWAILFLLLIGTMPATGDPLSHEGTLVIQVKTTAVPMRQFTAVKTTVTDKSGRLVKTIDYLVDRSTNAAGFRVAELQHLTPGVYDLKIGLYKRNTLLTERPAYARIEENATRVVAMLLVPKSKKRSSVKDQCTLIFTRQIENCRATARACLLGARGNCEARRQACEAEAEKERQQCNIKTRKTQGQMRRDMKAIDQRDGHIIPQEKTGRKKPTPAHLKNQYTRKVPTYKRSGATINIRVNYIARRSADSHVSSRIAPYAPGQINITGVNYISQKGSVGPSMARNSQHVSNRIAIANINYIARKVPLGLNVQGHRPASASETFRITNVNYIARKHP